LPYTTLFRSLLKRVVKLLRRQLLALLEIDGHELLIELDHLIDDLRMRARDGREVGSWPVCLEETVDDCRAAVRRQVQRQALRAEGFAQLAQNFGARCVAAVDPGDYDEPTQLAVARHIQ